MALCFVYPGTSRCAGRHAMLHVPIWTRPLVRGQLPLTRSSAPPPPPPRPESSHIRPDRSTPRAGTPRPPSPPLLPRIVELERATVRMSEKRKNTSK